MALVHVQHDEFLQKTTLARPCRPHTTPERSTLITQAAVSFEGMATDWKGFFQYSAAPTSTARPEEGSMRHRWLVAFVQSLGRDRPERPRPRIKGGKPPRA